jgi:hypothetical protein
VQLIMAWSNPGSIDFSSFTGYVVLFAKMCLNGRNRELGDWNDDTLKEMERWCVFMQSLREEMKPGDVAQAQRYLDDPLSFANTGHDNDNPLCVVEAKISCKVLSAAWHFLLRQLLKNPHLCDSPGLFKAVILGYLSMIDDPSDKPDAVLALVKDLMKEVSHSHLPAKFLGEWIGALAPALLYEEVGLSPHCLFDQELRVFVLRPDGTRSFGLSRALAPKLDGLSACEKCVQLCRKHPELVEVLLLTMIPRPLCLTSVKEKASCREQLSPLLAEMLVSCLIKSQHALNLWHSVEPLLLMKVAAENDTFCAEYNKQ